MLYGYHKDPVSRHATDRKASALLRAAPPPPKEWSNDSSDLEVLDQDLNDCVANYACETLMLVAKMHGVSIQRPSRRALYLFSRAEHGDQLTDGGTYLGTMWDAIAKLGFGPESLWPYDSEPVLAHDGSSKPRWQAMPSTEYFEASYPERTKLGVEYYRIDATGAALQLAVQQAISSQYGYGFGLDVTQAFEDQTGTSPISGPLSEAEILGGHALEGIAYDEHGIRGRSSWGRGFGLNGRYYISWSYLLNHASDHWVTRGIPAPKA